MKLTVEYNMPQDAAEYGAQFWALDSMAGALDCLRYIKARLSVAEGAEKESLENIWTIIKDAVPSMVHEFEKGQL